MGIFQVALLPAQRASETPPIPAVAARTLSQHPYARAREGVTRNVGLQTIKAAIEKAVMQRGSYPLARQSMGLSVMLPPVNRML